MRRRSWMRFWAGSAILVILTALGGALSISDTLGAAGSGLSVAQPVPSPGRLILLYAATWVTALLTLVLLPRRVSTTQGWTAVLGLAVICRLMLLPHPVSGAVIRQLGQEPHAPSGGSLVHQIITARSWSTAVTPGDNAAIPHQEAGTAEDAAQRTRTAMLGTVVTSLPLPILVLKLLLVSFDLATLIVLLLLLQDYHLELRWALVWACNPLVLYSFAGQAHPGAVAAFGLATAVLAYRRRSWWLLFLFLGLAAAANWLAVLCWPLFITRRTLRHAWIAPAIAALSSLPTLRAHGAAFATGTTWLLSDRVFNAPLYQVLHMLFGHSFSARCTAVGLLLLAWTGVCLLLHPQRRRHGHDDPVPGLLLILGAALLLSPAVPFWSLTLLLPWVVLRPSLSLLLLTLTIAFSFVACDAEPASLPIWALAGVWLLPLALMSAKLSWIWSRLGSLTHGWSTPTSVSIVLPVLNEEEEVAEAVAAVHDDPVVTEVIVVDAGSTDETVAQARAAGATVLDHQLPIAQGGGRGGQINAGCRRASGDVIVVVHADTLLAPATCSQILAVLSAHPDCCGGAVGSVFDGPLVRLRLIELVNDLRASLFGISFGDQVQFFRREAVVSQGLYPALPLMEDVELCLRLRSRSHLLFLWGDCLVSARRWYRGPRWWSLQAIRLFFTYLWCRLWGAPDTVKMYESYYPNRARSGGTAPTKM